MEYGKQLRIMRIVRGMSQVEVEDATGIPNTRLSLLETGKSLPNVEWAAAIKAALGWPDDELAEIAFGILEGEVAEAVWEKVAAIVMPKQPA